jgi:hypothetical protein
MSAGCTSCHRKGGCDHRKAGMFAAIEQALERLYPDRRWRERPAGPVAGVGSALGTRLAAQLARRLSTLTVYLPGNSEASCSYVYVLCTGRPPALIARREGLCPAGESDDVAPGRGALEELYLRVALSGLAPFAAVQQVTMRGEQVGNRLFVEEAPRSGVFDPPLLGRFRKLVAVLAELGIQHLDCGEIVEGPRKFDPGEYPNRFGQLPGIINYLFFPQPPATLTSTVVQPSTPPGLGARHFAIDGEPVSSNLDLIGG